MEKNNYTEPKEFFGYSTGISTESSTNSVKSKNSYISSDINRILSEEKLYNEKIHLLNEDLDDLTIVDTRSCNQDNFSIEDIPNKITGTYVEDYNIIYVDNIIRKKLLQEKYTVIPGLKMKYKILFDKSQKEQTFINRSQTLQMIEQLKKEIENIESNRKIENYDSRVSDILNQYKRYGGKFKTFTFEIEDKKETILDNQMCHKIYLIESFLEIASDYININVIRKTDKKKDICVGCGLSLLQVAISEEGTIRCPDCGTEHNIIILTKMSKDGDRINTTISDDESIDNFLRAFTRYQGLQQDRPDEQLYIELDEYFIKHDRLTGDVIRELPLNVRGRRGDTNHKMLWNALSQIGRSEYYEDANLIGHLYWGWTLPNVMHLKDNIIDKYNKTQMIFYQIPIEQRGRNSSLGTQFRLWRHLQLEGHECYMDEFKIAENPESLRTHNKLWRLMCEGSEDTNIRYLK